MQDLHQPFEFACASHPWVATYLQLRRATREELRVVVEGAGLLHAARQHGGALEVVLACPELWRSPECGRQVEAAQRAGTPVLLVSQRTFRRLSQRDGQDGVAAIARLRAWTLDDLTLGAVARVLVLDGFDLPGNLGSLIRCASAAGAAGVLLTNQSVRTTHPTVVKASVGAVFSVPTVATSPNEAISWLRKRGFRIVGADPAAACTFRQARYGRRVAVVVGSERRGLSEAWRQGVDQLVAIPMQGRVDSLNVGHAGAVVLFEVLHQQQEPS